MGSMMSRTSNMQKRKISIWIQPGHYMSNSHGSAHNATRLSYIFPPSPPKKHLLWNSIFMQVHCEVVPPCLHPDEDRAYLRTICFAELQHFYTHNLHRSQHYALAFTAFHLNFVQNIWLNNNVSIVSDCYNILQTFENYVTVVLWTQSMSFDVWTILFTMPIPLLLLTSPRHFLLVNKICLLQHINFTWCHSETE